MAGTIPNLPLSTQFDKDTGAPLRGGKLYFFQAGTVSTVQNAFKDVGLANPHPNPITLDGAGRVPSFYLADGSIHVRLTNAQGVVQFEELNLLVIGPSSGGGGSGTSVDATALFQTGDVVWLDQAGVRPGWVRDNGRTLGSSSSGASERANADCQSLYVFLWNTYPDTLCPVNGGRGASAADDWAANKWIALPDKRGFVPGGLPDMGNLDSGRLAGVPVVGGSATVAGSTVGEMTHTLGVTEIPSHTHTLHDPGHSHTYRGFTNGGGNQTGNTQDLGTQATSASTTGITIDPAGGGAAHNNVQFTVLGTFYRKL